MWTSFIGFMASGKTTVARRLQAATRRPTVSVDQLVVDVAGRSVADLFARDGEEDFRARELAALRALNPDRNLVVDCGGGIVQTPAAVEMLRTNGVVIWLDASWEIVRERLKQDGGPARPLVDRWGWSDLEQLFRRRRPLYAAAADFRLPSCGEGEQLARTAMLRSLLWSRRHGQGRR